MLTAVDTGIAVIGSSEFVDMAARSPKVCWEESTPLSHGNELECGIWRGAGGSLVPNPGFPNMSDPYFLDIRLYRGIYR